MNAISYTPQPRQALAHGVAVKQMLYGGAAGGGKSMFLRWDLIRYCLANPNLDAYLFRRTNPELLASHIRPLKTQLTNAGIPFVFNADEKRFTFPNGSGINCCYCEHEDDVTRYQSTEMHYLAVDEASHLTEHQLTYLRTRVRLGSYTPSPEYAGSLPRIVFTSNPGGPGHSFLKMTFIDPAPKETLFIDKSTADPDKGYPGHRTIYIPATMDDNQYLEVGYSGQFSALEPELAKALKNGDWDAIVGKAVHNLSRDKHQLRQFTPPRHWTRFMVIDWGTAKPFCVLWFCVSEGATLAAKEGWRERWLPSGALIAYREFYGWAGKPDKGCRMQSQKVAREILTYEGAEFQGEMLIKPPQEVMDYRIGDSQMWAQHDGPSVQENMSTATNSLVTLRKSQKDRKQNYAEIISRLAGNPDFMHTGKTEDHPMLFITANCIHTWRTVPTLTLDETDPEKGPATDLEDHPFDCLSYGCRSRPFVSTEEDRYETEYADEIREARGGTTDPYATRAA